MATTMPAIQEVTCGEAVAACFRTRASAGSTPVRFRPSTRMNRPATSGSTDQEMSRRTGSGDCRPISSTSAVTAAPAMKVGNPRSEPSAEATSSTTAVITIPDAASLPPRASAATISPTAATGASSARRCVSRSAR